MASTQPVPGVDYPTAIIAGTQPKVLNQALDRAWIAPFATEGNLELSLFSAASEHGLSRLYEATSKETAGLSPEFSIGMAAEAITSQAAAEQALDNAAVLAADRLTQEAPARAAAAIRTRQRQLIKLKRGVGAAAFAIGLGLGGAHVVHNTFEPLDGKNVVVFTADQLGTFGGLALGASGAAGALALTGRDNVASRLAHQSARRRVKKASRYA